MVCDEKVQGVDAGSREFWNKRNKANSAFFSKDQGGLVLRKEVFQGTEGLRQGVFLTHSTPLALD